MARRLKMAQIQAIEQLQTLQAGCAAPDSESKAAIPPTGSMSAAGANSTAQLSSNPVSPEGIVILPTKPYMPRHKGKVESGVKYVQGNALKGRKFPSNEAQNRFLADWETSVADTRTFWTRSAGSGRNQNNGQRRCSMPEASKERGCCKGC